LFNYRNIYTSDFLEAVVTWRDML